MFSNTFSFVLFLIPFAHSLQDGQVLDKCVLQETGEESVCVLLQYCKEAEKNLKQGKTPQNCGFQRNDPIVCCPNHNNTLEPGALAKKACDSMRNLASSALRKRRKALDAEGIIGGELAEMSEFQHMALVGFDNHGMKNWQCGGSLISVNYVLTAAHCLFLEVFGQVKYVRLGELDYSTNDDNSRYQDFTVAEAVKYPSFKRPSKYHDIALLKLDRPAQLNSYVWPACIHTDKIIPTNVSLVVAGWGKTDYYASSGSSQLRKATVELFSQESCARTYPIDKKRLENGIVEEVQVCAGSNVDVSNTCQGDSGGPLEIDEKLPRRTISTVVGITSFGVACGFTGVPGVYTRVAYYVEWIEDVVWKRT